MTVPEALAVLAAGVAAGGINTIVGSGSLITFPTLLAVGLPPVVANVSNNVGLVPGSAAGAYGYRAELSGQRRRLVPLMAASALGALVGAFLLLGLPEAAFRVIVPVLIVAACVLVLLQPRLSARLAARRDGRRPHGGPALAAAVLGSGIYGGYFGAAQGVILIGLLGSFLDDGLQRINAAKNVLALVVNGVAAVVFIAVARVDWAAAGLVAAGAIVGGLVGARVGRRLPPTVLRLIVVVVGVVAAVRLIVAD